MSTVSLHGQPFDVAGFSEQGPRPENQDAFHIEAFGETSLLALADGMGGERSGRLAADIALETIARSAPIRSIDDARRAVRAANDAVLRTAESNTAEYGGMGCALGLLALARNGDGLGWFAGHVGDVRILSRSPDGVLRLETRDHTPAFGRWEAGEISIDEIPDSAGANRLQRAVGRGGEADVVWIPAAPGWSWLIVSDGIYKAMRLDELAAALAAPTAEEAVATIRRKVGERGADDNYTAVVVRALPTPGAAAAIEGTERMTKLSAAPPGSASRGGLAVAVAALALALSGFALWMALENRGTASRAEIDSLRAEVDSLRALIIPVDPFGPSIPMDPPGQPGVSQPPPR